MKKLIIIILLVGLIASQVHAIIIGSFPGLKQLIDISDAIVVLRIERCLSGFGSATFYSTHECYIFQTLKGDIPKNTRINLQLMDTEVSFATPYAHGSTHLMFLKKKAMKDEPTEYRTIMVNGAHILLSPLGNEKMPEGKTIEQKVKNVIKGAIIYQAKEYEKRKMLLKTMFKGDAKKDYRIFQFNARFSLIRKGMTLIESLKILGIKRHDIYEIEHPDGRLIQTKLYWYSISDGEKTAKLELKIDRNGKVISKNKEYKKNTEMLLKEFSGNTLKGITRANEDIAAGKMKIIHYGKPWSQGKPLIDDESGLPVEIVAGCSITPALWEETDAYNKTMRQEMKDRNKPINK